MAVRVYKRTSAGRRNASVNLNSEVTKLRPEKTLLKAKHKKGGRNHHGVITQQCIGGGAKQRYRRIDFARNKLDQTGKVIGIEYDPNRTCHIALLQYEDGQKRYILAPIGLTDGDIVLSSNSQIEPKAGNAMPVGLIPAGLNLPQYRIGARQGWPDVSGSRYHSTPY